MSDALNRPVRTARRRWPALCAAPLAVAAAGAAAQAGSNEPNPYYFGLSEALTHTTNVYGLAGSPGDSFSTTSLFGGIDQSIGRQRLYGKANVDINRYSDSAPEMVVPPLTTPTSSDLNNVGYGLSGAWDWATIDKLSGTLSANATQTLANGAGSNTVAATVAAPVRDLVRTERYIALGRWGGDSTLTLQANLERDKVSFSAAQAQTGDSTQDSAALTAYYRAGGALRLGVAGRFSHTDQPTAVLASAGPPAVTAQSNVVTGHYVDLLADWTPSVQTAINGRVSASRQSNSNADIGALDFSGVTYSLHGNWAATGKITLRGGVDRNAGINGGLFNPSSAPTGTTQLTVLSSSSQVSNVASLGADYAATAKITASLDGSYTDSTIVETGAPTVHDLYKSLGLNLRYTYSRTWLFACRFSHASQSLPGQNLLSYSANVTSCSAQLTLQ